MYDIAPNNETTNVKGRLYEVRTRDEEGKEVREAFEYDLAGNVASTRLTVEVFDTRTRVTHYAYDIHNKVTRIVYPYDLSDTPGFEVHYFYNTAGQLASIGTADDPTCYAAYEYNIDGSIKTERLNKLHLQRDYRYDFQGHLLAIQDRNGMFSEELSYRDADGNFKDGNVAQMTITGSALSSPYSYSYQYDEHSRLTSAKTVAVGPSVVPHPDWDVEGPNGEPIGYDANGNMTQIKQGHISSTYLYKLDTKSPPIPPPRPGETKALRL